jgi:Domain of unknown function (DUF4157)
MTMTIGESLPKRADPFVKASADQVNRRSGRCSGGGKSGPGEECDACRAKRLSLANLPSIAAGSSLAPAAPPIPTAPRIQRKAVESSSTFDDQANVSNTGGMPLASDVRGNMERRFGTSFADVRIHADDSAGRTSEQLGARAFTKGRDVFFARGYYQTGTHQGLGLLAHELTHVVHQRSGAFSPMTTTGNEARRRHKLEEEAERNERGVTNSMDPLRVRERAEGPQIDRSPGLLDDIKAKGIRSIEVLADFLIANTAAGRHPLVTQLHEYRVRFKGMTTVELESETVAQLEAVYERARALAPFWMPVPKLSFAGSPVQQAGVLVIPAAVLALLAALVEAIFIILFIASALIVAYLITQLIEAFRKTTPRTKPETRPRPETEPRPETKPRPETRPKPETEPKPETKPKPETEPRPETKPKPETKPEPDVKPRPDTKPKPELDEPPKPGEDPPPPPIPIPQPYPICWPIQLGPPTQSLFVRVKGAARDEEEAQQARLALEWRKLRDPDFDPSKYHVHHVNPLFLGGADDLRNNGTTIPARLHLRGHWILRQQPQMLTPPPPLPPMPVDMYAHPGGTLYRLAGFKETAEEVCT